MSGLNTDAQKVLGNMSKSIEFMIYPIIGRDSWLWFYFGYLVRNKILVYLLFRYELR